MAIRDRDYMKRPSDDDDGARRSSPDSKVEEVLGRFLQKYPRFLLYLGIGVAGLVVVGLVLAKLSGAGR